MKVTFFHRKPFNNYFSIENLFAEIRQALADQVSSKVAVSPYPSMGINNRLKNLWIARTQQSEVNHITGDINYLALALKGSKTVLTIHDCGYMQTNNWLRRTFLHWFWIILPVRRVAVVTAISEASKRELLQYVNCSEEKVKVVHNFVSERYQYVPKAFNKEKPVLLHIGTKQNKNLPRLIAALEDIPCTLDIVGTLSEEQRRLLKKYRIDYKNAENISNDQIVEKYGSCDILTFLSTHEGFGLPIVEANATGRAVLTSNLSSMPEIASDAALLVNPYSIEEIRKGILRLIRDDQLRKKLIDKGLKNVARFRLKKIAEDYYKIYSSIAKENE
jgi:glycosyltransferase involved in cell wall biosynthesis